MAKERKSPVRSIRPAARKNPQRRGKGDKPHPNGSRSGPAGPPRAGVEASSYLAVLSDQLRDVELANSQLRKINLDLEQSLIDARATRGRFIELFEEAPVGYLLIDLHGHIQELNRAAAALLGTRKSAAIGEPLARYVARNEIAHLLAHLRESQLTRKQASTDLTLSSKSRTVVVQVITLPVESGPQDLVQRFRMMIIDTTEQRAAEAALTRAQEYYKRLVDAIEGIVWEADARTLDVTLVSRYAERLLGYPIEQWLRPSFWEDHIHVDDRERITNMLAKAISERQDIVLEYRVYAADRRVIWVHDSVSIVEQAGHLKLLGVAVDITGRKESEQELRGAHAFPIC